MSALPGVRTTHGARTGRTLVTVLLACGVVVAVVQVVGDVVTAAWYPGYSYVDQSVSELSAIGAPTRPFLSGVGILYVLLVLAFALGVWFAAGNTRAMRVTALLLALFAFNGLVWAFFPMQPSGSEMAATDIAHIVGAIVQVLTIVLFGPLARDRPGAWSRCTTGDMFGAGSDPGKSGLSS